MKRLVLAAALFGAASFGVAAQEIGGTYTVEGTNLDGRPYGGTAEIQLLSETTCQIRWTTGSTESIGICMRYGPAFAASYVSGEFVGLVIYQVMDDGTLDGIWTITGQNGSGTEVLHRQ
jgi:hypothetical protein